MESCWKLPVQSPMAKVWKAVQKGQPRDLVRQANGQVEYFQYKVRTGVRQEAWSGVYPRSSCVGNALGHVCPFGICIGYPDTSHVLLSVQPCSFHWLIPFRPGNVLLTFNYHFGYYYWWCNTGVCLLMPVLPMVFLIFSCDDVLLPICNSGIFLYVLQPIGVCIVIPNLASYSWH